MTIKELRALTGLSQRKFADKFHLNTKTVQAWEQGLRKCPDYMLWMISYILELEESIKNSKRLVEYVRKR